MKPWIIFAAFALSFLLTIFISPINVVDAESKINDTCTYNGVKLYGKVQVVSSFPDITIQQVDSFPDLLIQDVRDFPDQCGKWQIVDSFPDFKVKYVDNSADIKVKTVQSFPGLPS